MRPEGHKLEVTQQEDDPYKNGSEEVLDRVFFEHGFILVHDFESFLVFVADLLDEHFGYFALPLDGGDVVCIFAVAGVVLGMHSGPELEHQRVVVAGLVGQAESVDAEFLGGECLGGVLAAGEVVHNFAQVHYLYAVGGAPTAHIQFDQSMPCCIMLARYVDLH